MLSDESWRTYLWSGKSMWVKMCSSFYECILSPLKRLFLRDVLLTDFDIALTINCHPFPNSVRCVAQASFWYETMWSLAWTSCKIRKIAGCACTGNAGKVFPLHRTLEMPWCMPGSLTSGFPWKQWRGKHSRHSQRMHNPQIYISGKRPIDEAAPHFAAILLVSRT